jgi:hypothetical protein
MKSAKKREYEEEQKQEITEVCYEYFESWGLEFVDDSSNLGV